MQGRSKIELGLSWGKLYYNLNIPNSFEFAFALIRCRDKVHSANKKKKLYTRGFDNSARWNLLYGNDEANKKDIFVPARVFQWRNNRRARTRCVTIIVYPVIVFSILATTILFAQTLCNCFKSSVRRILLLFLQGYPLRDCKCMRVWIGWRCAWDFYIETNDDDSRIRPE